MGQRYTGGARIGVIHAYPGQYLVDSLRASGHRLVLIGQAEGFRHQPGIDAVLDVPLWDSARLHREVQALHQEWPLDALLPVNEGTVVGTASLAARLGLHGMPVAAAVASRHKLIATLLWESQGIPVPTTMPVSPESGQWPALRERLGERVVIKLTDSMNSQGVVAVRDAAGCDAAMATLRDMIRQDPARVDVRLDRNRFAYGHSSQPLMAQAMCDGPEVSVDVFLTDDGHDHVLALLQKQHGGGDCFAESASFWPTHLGAAEEARLLDLACRAARALGLRNGPAHVEIRYADGQPKVLEAGLRPGGGYVAQCIERLQGGNVFAAQAALALGYPVQWAPPDEPGAVLFGGVVIPRSGVLYGVSGLEVFDALTCVQERVILNQPGDRVRAMPESAQPHFCYYLLAGASRDALLEAHERIQQQVRLDVRPVGGRRHAG